MAIFRNKGAVVTHTYRFGRNGKVPNSPLPVVVYYGLFEGTLDETYLRELAFMNDWRVPWIEDDGIYRLTHWHTNTHEKLVVLDGEADIELGGPTWGKVIHVQPGSAIAIPAGVGHKRVRRITPTFRVAGLHPRRSPKWNLLTLTALASQLRYAETLIPKVPPVLSDAFYGENGPLMRHWRR